MEKSAPRPAAGIFWQIVTGLNFVAVTAIVKHVGSDVPAAQAAFLRYFLGLIFVLPMIRPILNAHLTRRQMTLFGARGVLHTGAVILWFFAMTQITIAEVTAMNYLAPIYITIGAVLLLGEKIAVRRILAIGVALIGALIILRPGFRELSPGHIAMLATAVMFAGGYLIMKVMSAEVNAAVVVGMLSLFVTLGLAPFAWAVWVPVTWEQIGWLFLVACFATAGHYTMTLAFAAAPLAVTQPVTFLQLVWSVLLGAVFFDERIDGWVVLGGSLIMASVSFIAWREHMLKKRTATAG